MNEIQKKALLNKAINLIDGDKSKETTQGILPYTIDLLRAISTYNEYFNSLNNQDKTYYIDIIDLRLEWIENNWKELHQVLDRILINIEE